MLHPVCNTTDCAPDKVKQIIGDANCFFRSLSFLISGDEQQHALVRALVVSLITGSMDDELKKIYVNWLESGDFEKLGDWATDAEVYILIACDNLCVCGQSSKP